jgi:Protein of unknown function (DUF4019)
MLAFDREAVMEIYNRWVRKDAKMVRKVVCLMAMGLILAPVTGRAQNANKEKAAVSAAEKWLGLIDAGNYAQSWKETSTFFRNAVTEGKWEQALQAFRKPLGKLVSRAVKTRMYRTSLPGAPDGQYVVIEFATSFTNKKSAVETVTATLDKDTKWRVAGYFIK